MCVFTRRRKESGDEVRANMAQTGATDTHQCFTLLHILLPEQKLAIEIGKVYRIQIQQGDVSKAREHNVLH
jgi:hypothetical protein